MLSYLQAVRTERRKEDVPLPASRFVSNEELQRLA
jgi:hypothetical protein